jgi:hypothetical protein
MSPRASHSPRVWLIWSLLIGALCSAGCGPGVYTARILAASNRLESARQDNARWYAPYEFQMAESHLLKAEEEAAEASYEEAIHYARAAEAFAQKSIDLSRERRVAQ